MGHRGLRVQTCSCTSVHDLRPHEDTDAVTCIVGKTRKECEEFLAKATEDFKTFYPAKPIKPIIVVNVNQKTFSDNYRSVFDWACSGLESGSLQPNTEVVYDFKG